MNNVRRIITSCTCRFCIQDAYHLIIECPRHKEMCEITDIYKAHLPDEEKKKYEMLHEKKMIKSIHLQNDYGITRLEHRQQIKATTLTKAWNKCIEKMEKTLGDTVTD